MDGFPETEAGIEALARTMIEGLRNNPDLFPDPPIPLAELEAGLATYVARRKHATQALDACDLAGAERDAGFHALVEGMRGDPRSGGLAVGYDDDPVDMRERDRHAARALLQPPGQVRTLEIVKRGEGWVYLDWKAPKDGAPVGYYRIERRDPSDGAWTDVTRTPDRDVTLGEQERGKTWEYRVIAVNGAGRGLPSEPVAAVL